MKNPFKSLADKFKKKSKESKLDYSSLFVPKFFDLEAAANEQQAAYVVAIEEGKHVIVYADISPDETARYDLKDTGHSIVVERSWPSTHINNHGTVRQSWVLNYNDVLSLLYGLKAIMEGSGLKPGEWFQVTNYAPKTKSEKAEEAKPPRKPKKAKPAAKPKKVKAVKAKPKKKAKKGGKK